MDGQTFDALVRRLGLVRSRRAFLRGVLGGGATVAGGMALAEHAQAARRPAGRPQSPVRCPGIQYLQDGSCVCPPGNTRCGSDCCPDEVAVCCDNACCYGHCSDEEYCCEGDNWCEATGECCGPERVCCGDLGCVDGECQCRSDSLELTCAGKCGAQTDNCGEPVECTPCIVTCSSGQQATNEGCVDCPAGTYSSDGIACDDCAAGTFSGAGASSCTACPAETYTDTAAQAECISCADGYTTNGQSGATACSLVQTSALVCEVDAQCQSQCPGAVSPYCYCGTTFDTGEQVCYFAMQGCPGPDYCLTSDECDDGQACINLNGGCGGCDNYIFQQTGKLMGVCNRVCVTGD